MTHPHAALIEELGDATDLMNKLEAETGIKPSCTQIVSSWKTKGIYWHWRNAVATIAKREGVALPPGFLGPKGAR